MEGLKNPFVTRQLSWPQAFLPGWTAGVRLRCLYRCKQSNAQPSQAKPGQASLNMLFMLCLCVPVVVVALFVAAVSLLLLFRCFFTCCSCSGNSNLLLNLRLYFGNLLFVFPLLLQGGRARQAARRAAVSGLSKGRQQQQQPQPQQQHNSIRMRIRVLKHKLR